MFSAKLKIIGILTNSTSFTSTSNASEMVHFHFKGVIFTVSAHWPIARFFSIPTNNV